MRRFQLSMTCRLLGASARADSAQLFADGLLPLAGEMAPSLYLSASIGRRLCSGISTEATSLAVEASGRIGTSSTDGTPTTWENMGT